MELANIVLRISTTRGIEGRGDSLLLLLMKQQHLATAILAHQKLFDK